MTIGSHLTQDVMPGFVTSSLSNIVWCIVSVSQSVNVDHVGGTSRCCVLRKVNIILNVLLL